MKKLIALLLATLMVFSLVGCGKEDIAGDTETNNNENAQSNIQTSDDGEYSQIVVLHETYQYLIRMKLKSDLAFDEETKIFTKRTGMITECGRETYPDDYVYNKDIYPNKVYKEEITENGISHFVLQGYNNPEWHIKFDGITNTLGNQCLTQIEADTVDDILYLYEHVTFDMVPNTTNTSIKQTTGNPFSFITGGFDCDLTVTTENDSNHKNANDTINNDKITHKGDVLVLKLGNVYECDNIGEDATITFTPEKKQSKNNGLPRSIECTFTANPDHWHEYAEYSGDYYESATFSQDGSLMLEKAKNNISYTYKYTDTTETGSNFYFLRVTGTLKKEASVNFQHIGENKFKVTSTSDISEINIEYNCEINGNQTSTNNRAGSGKVFTFTIENNQIIFE